MRPLSRRCGDIFLRLFYKYTCTLPSASRCSRSSCRNCAAGVGSGLADLLAGYAHYVPGTFVIKGLVALIAAFMVRPILKKDEKLPFWKLALCELPSEAFMVAGYFGYKALILQKGLAAAASIPNNLVQGALGIALSVLLYTVLCRVPDVHKTFWKGV